MSSQRQLPPILAFGDALDRVEDRTDDPEAERYVREIREGLDDLAARDPDSRAAQVTSLENLIDSLLTYVDGDAEMWARTIQNRFANYRHTRRASSANLHVSNGRIERDGEAVGTDAPAGEARLRGSLVNNGERSDAMVSLAFYDDRDRAVWKVESRVFEVAPGERRDLGLTVYVPEGTAYYAVGAFEPDDPAAVAGDAPTPGRESDDGTSYVD